jgi:ribonucleoside-triphosphate reductase
MIKVVANFDLDKATRQKYIKKVNEHALKCGDQPDDVMEIHLSERENGDVTVDYLVGKTKGFERIRRITGYLVGTVDRWNDAKKAELADRVKHA